MEEKGGVKQETPDDDVWPLQGLSRRFVFSPSLTQQCVGRRGGAGLKNPWVYTKTRLISLGHFIFSS